MGGSKPAKLCCRRGQGDTPATQPSLSALCPLQLVYPSDFRLTDKEVRPGPLGGSCRPGTSRPSLGVLCFRKAVSATCPFPTPTQVGDLIPPSTGWGVGTGRRWGGEAAPSLCGKRCLCRGTSGVCLLPTSVTARRWVTGSAPPQGPGVWAGRTAHTTGSSCPTALGPGPVLCCSLCRLYSVTHRHES